MYCGHEAFAHGRRNTTVDANSVLRCPADAVVVEVKVDTVVVVVGVVSVWMTVDVMLDVTEVVLVGDDVAEGVPVLVGLDVAVEDVVGVIDVVGVAVAVAVVLHSSVSASTISGATEPESHVTVPVSAGQTLKMLFSTVACDSQLSVTVMYFKSPAEQPK